MVRIINQYRNSLSKSIINDKENDYVNKLIVSVVLLCASIIMLLINIINDQTLMIKCSIILVVGFLTSSLIAVITKNDRVSGFIIGLLVCLILSVFAISGGNNGFAILWVLLVPIMAINLLGVINGLLISIYFLVFIFVLFYTDLKSIIIDKYSIEFISRFPVLYFSDFIISTYLSLQKESYYRDTILKSYMDELTGVYNRRYFVERVLENNDLNNDTIGVMVIDVNGLKIINDTKGHKVGDELIKAVPICIKEVFGENIEVCRIGGDEFALILNMDDKDVNVLIKEVKEYAKNYKNDYIDNVSFSIGYASNNKYEVSSINELFVKADSLMYKDKKKHYRKIFK